MHFVLYDWPFAGLALAAALVAWLLFEPRPAAAPPRLRDPAFVLPLLWPMYLVHQFEEHGYDVLGDRFAFLGSICATIGHPDLATCPGDAAFIFAVNVIACPLAFVLPLLFRRTRPLLAVFAWSVPLVNGVIHVVTAAVDRAYNPGLLTSVVLFAPLCALMLRTVIRAGILAPRRVVLLFACGGLLHAVLVGSLLARAHGWIGEEALLFVNGANGILPWAFGLAIARPRREKAWSPSV